jgi:hypothetical protein
MPSNLFFFLSRPFAKCQIDKKRESFGFDACATVKGYEFGCPRVEEGVKPRSLNWLLNSRVVAMPCDPLIALVQNSHTLAPWPGSVTSMRVGVVSVSPDTAAAGGMSPWGHLTQSTRHQA